MPLYNEIVKFLSNSESTNHFKLFNDDDNKDSGMIQKQCEDKENSNFEINNDSSDNVSIDKISQVHNIISSTPETSTHENYISEYYYSLNTINSENIAKIEKKV